MEQERLEAFKPATEAQEDQRLLSLRVSRVMMKIAASAVFRKDFPPKTWNLLDVEGSELQLHLQGDCSSAPSPPETGSTLSLPLRGSHMTPRGLTGAASDHLPSTQLVEVPSGVKG